METFAYYCLLGSAFTVAFSLPVGRALLAICLIFIAVHLIRERRLPVITVTTWIGLLFIAVAIVATVFGPNPSVGVPKLRKLIWFIGIPVSATLVSSHRRLSGILRAYGIGTGVLSVCTCVMNPIHALSAVRSGEAVNFMSAFISEGSMTNGQRLMLGIVICLGFLFTNWKEKRRSFSWWILLVLQCAALLLTFKRGSWICTCILVSVFVAGRTNWKYLMLVLVVIFTAVALPPVRARLGALREEFRIAGGGRFTMWFKIAPALIKKYPWGVGYRSLTNEMMREIAPEVERNRNHLHSNIAQVLVETGWFGLFVYLAWMTKAVVDAVRFVRCGLSTKPFRQAPAFATEAPPEAMPRREATAGKQDRLGTSGSGAEQTNAMVLLLMLIGLLANGLVEYNFADAELVIVYAFIMGCVGAGLCRLSATRPESPTLGVETVSN